ncbi:MAG TPA: hypothetical protein VG015_03675 [Candidatus Dormibacteraeota bacterium]|nr:hypothetical protein [Candidatus Dormibacteraeota bacterium]
MDPHLAQGATEPSFHSRSKPRIDRLASLLYYRSDTVLRAGSGLALEQVAQSLVPRTGWGPLGLGAWGRTLGEGGV